MIKAPIPPKSTTLRGPRIQCLDRDLLGPNVIKRPKKAESKPSRMSLEVWGWPESAEDEHDGTINTSSQDRTTPNPAQAAGPERGVTLTHQPYLRDRKAHNRQNAHCTHQAKITRKASHSAVAAREVRGMEQRRTVDAKRDDDGQYTTRCA